MRFDRSHGVTLIELLAVLAVAGILLAVAIPAAENLLMSGRVAAAARDLAGQLHAMRFKSVATRRSHGLFFDRDADGWHWWVVRDGNANGLRTREVLSGVDATLSGPHRPEDRVGGVRLGFPDARPIPRIPPNRGPITRLDDPVQFGRSDIISFSPIGRASGGTVYLTGGRYRLAGIVLYGRGTRIRVWRYDAREGRWRR